MQYMFLIYGNEATIAATPDDEMQQHIADNFALVNEATQQGALRAVGALQPTATSTTVRGRTLVTDGPFAETKEQLGGYYILECANLDEALAWARKMPCCGGGCVEIRPLLDMSGDA